MMIARTITLAPLLAAGLALTPSVVRAESCPAPADVVTIASFDGNSSPAATYDGAPLGHPTHALTISGGCPLASVIVHLSWDNPAEDLDLYAYDGADVAIGNSQDVNAGQTAPTETLDLGPLGDGSYTLEVRGYVSAGSSSYQLRVDAIGGGTITNLPPETAPKPRVVVAVPDSGINPYHAFYREGSPIYPFGAPPNSVTEPLLADFGVPVDCRLELTRTGDFGADYKADIDSGLWARAADCDVVWFVGTNVLAKSFASSARLILPDDEEDTHGVGTSAAVLYANPEAVLVFLEGTSDAASQWAFRHPHIDIVSTSYGPVGSAPIPENLGGSFEGVYEHGKMHFGACDNTPSTAPQDGTCGAWWSIGVAGMQEAQENEPETSSNSRDHISGTFPDFISDFTQTIPYCANCEGGYSDGISGTSFATPRSAGTASKIVLEARKALGQLKGIRAGSSGPVLIQGDLDGSSIEIDTWQMRRALEESAWIPGQDDLNPDAIPGEVGSLGVPVPVNPVAPWLQTGWGALTPADAAGVVDSALVHIGFGDGAARTKSGGYCEFQTGLIQARKFYWDNVAVLSETFGNAPDPDPFLFCELGNFSSGGGDTDPPPPGDCPALGETRDTVFTGTVTPGVSYDATDTVGNPVHAFEISAECPVSNVTLTLEWDQLIEDIDLFVTDGSGADVDNSQDINAISGPVEVLDLGALAADTYEATVRSFVAAGVSSYTLTVTETGTLQPNTAPVASGQTVSTNQDTAVSITLQASDADNDPLSFAIASGPANGSLSALSGNELSYTPNTGFSGSDSFTFTANDGTEDSAPATVSITVVPDEGGPRIVARLLVSTPDGDEVGTPVRFDARGSTYGDGGAIESPRYTFVFGDGNEVRTEGVAVVDHAYSEAGTYRPYVVIGDANGLTGISDRESVTTRIVIRATNDVPEERETLVDEQQTATGYDEATDPPSEQPMQVFTLQVSDPDPDDGMSPGRLEFGVDLDNEDEVVSLTLSGPGLSKSVTFDSGAHPRVFVDRPQVGSYTVELHEVRTTPGTAMAIFSELVMLGEPAVRTAARLRVDKTSGPVPLHVTFDGTLSVAREGAQIVEYAFDFDGDGVADIRGSNAIVSHVYTVAGTFRPSLTVTDNTGTQSKATAAVKAGGSVVDDPAAPTAGGGSLGWLVLLPLFGGALIRRRRR